MRVEGRTADVNEGGALCWKYGMSIQEIAEVMKVSEVRVCLCKALKKMRQYKNDLEEYL